VSLRQDLSSNLLQRAGLGAHSLLKRSGAMDLPGIRRLFTFAYERYKAHLEKGAIAAQRRVVTEGSLVIDVGANVGFFTTRFAKWVGERGHVIALEPELQNFETLKRRVSEEGVSQRVTLINAVAAAQNGVLRLKRNEDHPGDHRIATDDQGVEVGAVTLDDIAARNADRPLSLIKIDVQGAEMIVLSGAGALLATSSAALLIEIDEAQLLEFGTSVEGLFQHLASAGYTAHDIGEDGSLTAVDLAGLRSRLVAAGYLDILFLKSAASG